MGKARSWAGDVQVDESVFKTANTKAMTNAVAIAAHWSVEGAVEELGSNRDLAIALIAARGGVVEKKSISSQMRNIQRWLLSERGITGKQAHGPSKPLQKVINRVMNGKRLDDGQGVGVSMSGGSGISVNGYRRSSRVVEFDLNDRLGREEILDLLDEPSWDGLAEGYGVSELHSYGDIDISLDWF